MITLGYKPRNDASVAIAMVTLKAKQGCTILNSDSSSLAQRFLRVGTRQMIAENSFEDFDFSLSRCFATRFGITKLPKVNVSDSHFVKSLCK